jgi:hypothetical protein
VKKLLFLFAIMSVFIAPIIGGCQLGNYEIFSEIVELHFQRTDLDEAKNTIGISVPVPAYLPKGYDIQEIYLDDSWVRMLVSDQSIEKELVTHTDAFGTRQRYEVQCKMTFSVHWWEAGAPPVRLPVEKVSINGIRAYLLEKEDRNVLWWNWQPDNKDKPGMFELALEANKKISKKELIKVAESIEIK